jgi:HK97 family phage prohead protease
MLLERKARNWVDCEVKIKGDELTFEGIASTFGNTDSYGDTVVAGAYTESLATRTPALYFNHESYRRDMAAKVGRIALIEEQKGGLFVAGKLTAGHPIVANIWPSVKAGDIDGLSIGYRAKEQKIITLPDGSSIRELHKIDLFEVSLVENPADAFARVDIASVKSMRDAEESLREAGFSRDAAKVFISHLKGILRGDEQQKSVATHNTAALELLRQMRESLK